MAGNATTKTGDYLKMMAREGHYKQKLGEAALALTEMYCKADLEKRRRMGNELAEQVQHVLHVVYGWSNGSARDAALEIRQAFKRAGGEA
jgi:hypothetical protein